MREDRQRIDKWLWHARVVRTRSAAAALAVSGHVRVNGARIDAASHPVKVGDVVTIALDRAVRVLTITGFAARRGGSDVARKLYQDLTPVSANNENSIPKPSVARETGACRLTKRERRAIGRFTLREDT